MRKLSEPQEYCGFLISFALEGVTYSDGLVVFSAASMSEARAHIDAMCVEASRRVRAAAVDRARRFRRRP